MNDNERLLELQAVYLADRSEANKEALYRESFPLAIKIGKTILAQRHIFIGEEEIYDIAQDAIDALFARYERRPNWSAYSNYVSAIYWVVFHAMQRQPDIDISLYEEDNCGNILLDTLTGTASILDTLVEDDRKSRSAFYPEYFTKQWMTEEDDSMA